MILDGLLMFSNGQTFTTTANSTNEIDLGVGQATSTTPAIPAPAQGGGARVIGNEDDPAMKLLVQVATTFTSGGAPTLTVGLQGAPDNGSGAPGTYVTWWTSPAYALATLVAGARLYDMDMPRPPAGVVVPRFLRLSYTVGVTTYTGGAISAFIVLDRWDQMYNSTSNAVPGGYVPGITIAN